MGKILSAILGAPRACTEKISYRELEFGPPKGGILGRRSTGEEALKKEKSGKLRGTRK